MNINDLSREKQLLLLGGIMGAIAVFLAIQWGILPLMASAKQMEQEYNEIDSRLRKAERLIKFEGSLSNNLTVYTHKLEQTFVRDLPATENTLAWATLTIYGIARQSGLEIDSLAEAANAAPWMTAGPKKGGAAQRRFDPYSVQVACKSDYATLRTFISALERNPYLTITALSIQGGGTQKHTVNLTLCWPIWNTPAQLPEGITVKYTPSGSAPG